MLNSSSLNTVQNARFTQRFLKPCYDSYCFSNIPATIEYLLTGSTPQPTLPLDVLGNLSTHYDRIILFFVDAFGWNQFERFAESSPMLKMALDEGVVSKLTSQFPSTTAAHVTCIHTGLPVGQSGVFEWNYYEPLVDEIISPLLFSYAGDKYQRDTLRQSTIASSHFFPRQTFYHTLQARGIPSHILQYQAYIASTYSEIVFRGANIHPYHNAQDALEQAADLLLATKNSPGYYFLYFDRIDVTSHHYGPYSTQTSETATSFLQTLEKFFYNKVHGKVGKTLLLLTADHGQVDVNPRITTYLNRRYPKIEHYLKTNRKGNLLVPGGSARDMFLYIRDKYVDQVVTDLRKLLAGRAEVYRTQELIEQQFFGPQPLSQVLLSRLGNVVVLPYKYESVWWYESGKFEMHFQGHHGGLTPEEMEIPFLALPL